MEPTPKARDEASQTKTPSALFIGSRIFRGSIYGKSHPLAIQRVPAVTDLVRALNWLPDALYRTAPQAKPVVLTRFHDAEYIAALQKAERDGVVSDAVRERFGLGTPSNPIFPEMFRRPATGVGGGMLAAELVSRFGTIYNPGGGTHHGLRNRASGFCFLNEPVLTIQRVLELGLGPVAYVDIDAHHGDGVELAFSGSTDVRVISIHEKGRWPRSGSEADDAGGAALNLPVPKGLNDSEFDLLFDQVILPFVRGFQPGTIFLQCGADALLEDPLSQLALSNNSHVRAAVALRKLAPRLIVSGGGGYNPWSTARCWARVWGALSGASEPATLPAEAKAVLQGLQWDRAAAPSELLLSQLQDPRRDGAIRDEILALRDRLVQRL